ncbi:MAG: YihY/virulence factor BrkB family protein [Deltaproteobacteria bacterium]|nr:YihY/virulence factor BrkB family protein [Deltaproteobacteria bacterium]
MNLASQIQDYVNQRLVAEKATGLKRRWLELLQIILLACRGLAKNRSWLQAASLSYATILALIPLLALLFAILKGLGIQRVLASHLMDRLAPGAHDFAVQIINYIEGTKVTSLGIFGVIWLLAALVILMTTVEQAFNTAWQVAQTRPWRRKLSDYLSIFLLFPILMAVAISLSSGILSQPHLRRFLADFVPGLYFATTSLLSLGLLWVAFTFIYMVMPYTRVQLSSALLGGIIGGSLWQLAHLIFAMFQSAATYYNAIYGALYHLLFLVIWMFWSWLVVLFGTEVAHAHQNLEQLRLTYSRPGLDQEPVDEYLALAALVAICTRFAQRRPLMTPNELNHLFPQDNFLAARIINVLKECRLILEMAPVSDEEPSRFVPAMPLDQMNVNEVLTCLRAARREALAQAAGGKPEVGALLSQMAELGAPSPWDSMTLAELVELSLTESK